jgi:diguanylate cyclase (GGDEF)-like protein
MAYRDSLTGLPNRQSFYESLNQQLRLLSRRDKFLGLLFIDVDGFKPVNDTYGHKAGDFILTTLAVRVNNCIRQADTLFRLAGDEFVIIVSELEAEDGLHIIARKVVDSMHRPTSWEGHILDVSLSVGGVMTKNSDLHQDEFLHKADEAMYISKNTGKGKYTFLGIL